MAVLAAYDLADLFPWLSLRVYTVGAPRPGNKAFAKQYEAKVPDTWHIINDRVIHCSCLHRSYIVTHPICSMVRTQAASNKQTRASATC